jgi:hypothetical protein
VKMENSRASGYSAEHEVVSKDGARLARIHSLLC